MRLFAYMDADAYEALNRDGRIIGSPEHSPHPEFAAAYGWLADVMRRRLGHAPDGCHPNWPVFAWALHNGLSPLAYNREQDRPRSEDPNEASFLIGFDVPDGSYLLSDFDDWHFVLNNWYLPSGGSSIDETDECDAFEAFCKRHERSPYGYDGLTAIPEVEAMRQANWERIVDRPYDNGSVQASLWELRAEWVFLVKARRYHAIKGLAKPKRKRPRAGTTETPWSVTVP
ncbi:DUF3841 domain-containing protein [Pararhizobium sp. BT-229]|uniref:DUF3841 domain-containing protein n=1 Tax=Pararhizobium sp. BT-229 TaxID=2986923 RepID=UPI0021F7C68C|nr:DUF3841 domain-containing protein [Pararhizobium sp. BT-229]MCV9964443.1 DUF3841 domain-containing protein [Pararhizobium sp. BT-229]